MVILLAEVAFGYHTAKKIAQAQTTEFFMKYDQALNHGVETEDTKKSKDSAKKHKRNSKKVGDEDDLIPLL